MCVCMYACVSRQPPARGHSSAASASDAIRRDVCVYICRFACMYMWFWSPKGNTKQ